VRPILFFLLLAALALAGGPPAHAIAPGTPGAVAPDTLGAVAPDTLGAASPDTLGPAASDTLRAAPPGPLEFSPPTSDSDLVAAPARPEPGLIGEAEWLSALFGERLITEPEAWRAWRGPRARGGHDWRLKPIVDYNRVDLFRAGIAGEAQDPSAMAPRLGGRFEYATGRRRALYGAQIEQPLLPPGWLAFGVSMSRRTDHSELQQAEDVENSLTLLFARQDYRDYFEREGFGAYLAWRVPDFSVISLHARNDTYRSLKLQDGTHSIFERQRVLRENPEVDEGDIHAVLLRLERQTRHTARTRAGFYHWIELERAGHGLGGDFEYTRALADLRSVLRLSPTATLALRAAGGTAATGVLPLQKEFTTGGVDGLRAHAFAQYRGNQLLLAQAEYTTALWRVRPSGFDGGLHAIAFVDAGRAWNDAGHGWRPDRQQLRVDGGFGLTTAEDNLRVYVARNLQRPRSGAVFSVRLQRPF
jgi:hypothetical protein